ncbi:hypothetical protein B0H14DRAFT_2654984 [Mycena olivaceomarginata]|nr:hypothetical protein B0H14DRAFT_2654984 [Mycena olivaceomarginata]
MVYLRKGRDSYTRKSAPRMKVLAPGTVSRLEEKREERPEGWLWQLGKMGRLSQNEMDEWSSEGDRVQWFRAEAEMQRWQEQKEQKLIELLRTVRRYLKMQQVWTQLADGHAAYATQKAAMYQRRTEETQKLVQVGGYGFLLESMQVRSSISRRSGQTRASTCYTMYWRLYNSLLGKTRTPTSTRAAARYHQLMLSWASTSARLSPKPFRLCARRLSEARGKMVGKEGGRELK